MISFDTSIPKLFFPQKVEEIISSWCSSCKKSNGKPRSISNSSCRKSRRLSCIVWNSNRPHTLITASTLPSLQQPFPPCLHRKHISRAAAGTVQPCKTQENRLGVLKMCVFAHYDTWIIWKKERICSVRHARRPNEKCSWSTFSVDTMYSNLPQGSMKR